MRRWFVYVTLAIVACFVVGLGLIWVSGHGGNRSGGSPVVWHVGGLMVYASVLCAPLCLIAGVVALAVEEVVDRQRRRR